MSIGRSLAQWRPFAWLNGAEHHPPRSPGVVVGFGPQWQRALRYLSIAQQPGDDITRKQDEWVTFFMHCWHVWDQIEHDHTISRATRRACRNTAHRRGSGLAVCHEITIGVKHFATYEPTSAQMEGHHDRDIILAPLPATTWPGPGEAPPDWRRPGDPVPDRFAEAVAHVLITFGDKRTERAADVAVRAINEWRDVLTRRGLI